MRILFIGNSHTYYNDMPHMFANICHEHHTDTEITMLAHAGMGWDFHVNEPEVRFNIAYGESAQAQMSDAYRKLQEETGCELAPVGDRWWAYHREHPEIELYAKDGQHASETGSRLAAATIAEVVLNGVK